MPVTERKRKPLKPQSVDSDVQAPPTKKFKEDTSSTSPTLDKTLKSSVKFKAPKAPRRTRNSLGTTDPQTLVSKGEKKDKKLKKKDVLARRGSKSKIFEGLCFALAGKLEKSRDEITALIEEHGGMATKNITRPVRTLKNC
jgi:NAD-dependent DNA ligase